MLLKKYEGTRVDERRSIKRHPNKKGKFDCMKKNHIVKNLEEILERLDDMSKIILSADSTCDLSVDLKEHYEVNYFPFHIILEEVDYLDNIDITPKKYMMLIMKEKCCRKQLRSIWQNIWNTLRNG